MPETEDHIAYLCEVMRYLIAGDDVAVANLTRQSRVLRRPPAALGGELCDAISAHPKARFYARSPTSRAPSSMSKRRASTCSIERARVSIPETRRFPERRAARVVSATSAVAGCRTLRFPLAGARDCS
jgi:hypothetical protein